MSDPNKNNPQFNINNLDAALLTKALSEHQNTVIKSIFIIGSLIWVVMMFSDHHHKEWELRFQMTQAQEKLAALKDRDDAMKALNNFKVSVPKKLNEFELITLISDYAKLQHVNITSLSPAESKDMGMYDIINFSFDAVSDNFKDMMLFLRKIEKSNFPLRINSWSGHENEDGTINFVMDISAVLIHT